MKKIINYAKGLNAKENVIELIEKVYDNQDLGEFEHIIDYLTHKNFENLEWASYDLLKSKSEKWIKQLSKNVVRIDEEENIDFDVVLDFEDGFRFVQLKSKKAYQREGALMSHCVASYYERDVKIYSLRDAFNKPHCTIEKDTQIKGKGNGDISPKYVNYVVKFLEFTGMKVRDSEMKNLGYSVVSFSEYVKDKSKLYRERYVRNGVNVEYQGDVIVFKKIKEAVGYNGEKVCLFDGNVDFYNNKLTNLGKLKEISGFADFRYSKITNLGELEKIGGYAYFGESNITNLGELKLIGGSANFQNSNITNLGELEKIGGYSYFGYSKITSLGKLKKIGGSADFRYSKITNLGILELIGAGADFRNSNITSLGKLEAIGGYADFRESNITNLGELKKIGGSTDFYNSKLTNLGKLKEISGNANFYGSKIESLGNLKIIGGNANFEYSKITNLGELEKIGGDAYFTNSNITNLGKLKTIGEDVYFRNSKITNWKNVNIIGKIYK